MTDPHETARSVARHAREKLPAVDHAVRALEDAALLVPLLALLRDPAVRRPWRETHLDPHARAERDYQARAELEDRTEAAPGEHRDAARPDVLDALTAILGRAENLAWHLSRAAWCPVLPDAPADADPRPYLARAAACLPAAVTGWENGKDIAYWAVGESAAMLRELESALALVADGHTVKAVCPWCSGGLSGAYTWRVRVLPGDAGVGIVCETGALCNPPARDVGTWWQGCPTWLFTDWPWLARRIAHLDRRAQLLNPPAPPPPIARAQGATGRAGSPTTPAAEVELLAGLAPDPEGNAA